MKAAIQDVGDDEITLSGRLVAVVDDDELFCSYLAYMLMPLGVTVDVHANSDSLAASLARKMPDCIFLDYNIVHENGLFVQQQLRARFPNLAPVVIMSGDETQRTVIRALRSGVDDFVPKRGLKLDEIESALRRAIEKREANSRAGSKYAHSSAIDHVTGMFARSELEAKLGAIEEMSGRVSAVGIILVHFSCWSEIATRFGLVMAEKVLRGFATRLSASVGAEFVCGRYADDVLCCLIERIAVPAQFEARARAAERALTYSQNLGAVQFQIEPRIEVRTRPAGGPPLGALLSELSALFDAQRKESLAMVAARGETQEPEPSADVERRRSVRRRVFKRGSVARNGGASRLPCTIRNLSQGGACIRLESTLATPELFSLSLGEGEAPRKVRRRWQTNHDIGVEFID